MNRCWGGCWGCCGTEQHQEHIDWLSPGIENQREEHQNRILQRMAALQGSCRQLSVKPRACQIAQGEGRQEDEEEKQV